MRPLVGCLLVFWPALAMAETWEARGRRSAERDQDSGKPGVALSLSLHGGAVFIEGNRYLGANEGLGMAGGWIGATLHPRPATASLFLAAGVELGGVFSQNGGSLAAFEFVPEARAGLAILGKPMWEFFPHLELYVLSGYRVANPVRGPALRLGAGISIPSFAVAQFEFFRRSFPPIIPWMAEIIYDASEVPEVAFRVGYHF